MYDASTLYRVIEALTRTTKLVNIAPRTPAEIADTWLFAFGHVEHRVDLAIEWIELDAKSNDPMTQNSPMTSG